MKPKIASSALLRPRNMVFIALVAVGLALVEAFVDAVTWVELDVAAIYGLPLVIAALTRSRRLLWALTAALTIATFAVYAVQIPTGAFALSETFFVNRLFDAVAVLLTAGLLHVWIISVDTVEAQARLLKAQNDELEAANLELVRREEKIARQNEELERRRREAEEASARKTQLLAAASHDIRTPVNTINLMAEVIRRTAENPALAAQVPKLAQRLQANALSLADLLSAVLDTARLESGRVEYHETTFSLNTLLASSCEDFGPAAQAKGLRLQIEIAEPTIWLRTDRVKLQRVISNLVSNAIKFTEHGTVTITAALTPDRVAVICVQDTGIGIAPQQLERIFTEFAQVGNPSSDGNSGWGLGLAICRRLVKLIGGRITVESKLNQGSVFKVRLPPACVVDEPKDESAVALQMKVKSYP
jgi:signal transduction histidine kinase